MDLDNYIEPKGMIAIDEKGEQRKELFLLNYENVETISIDPLSKIETIDFQNVADRSLKLFRRLKSITCPKSIKLTHVPTTIQLIRN